MVSTTRQNGKPKADGAQLFDQPLPAAIEAEQSVLGAFVNEPGTFADYGGSLAPEDFFDTAHQTIFATMRDVYRDQQTLDVVLLVDELKKRGTFAAVGGAAYIARLSGIVPTAWHLEKYVNRTIEAAKLRSLITEATRSIRDAYDRTSDARTLIRDLEARLGDLAEYGSRSTLFHASEAFYEAIDEVRSRREGGVPASCLKTGFHNFDTIVGGLQQSGLIVLAARPSMGKTAWAMNVSANVAHEGGTILFVSLEMSRRELGSRLASSESRVNGHRMRNGSVSEDDVARMVNAYDRLKPQDGLVFDEPSSCTVLDIRASARRVKRERGRLDLIVVDYLGLISPDDAKLPRQEQVATISRQLKKLARDMKVPVLCLAQLNRQSENGKDNRPKLSHLRESGAIEQDADMVLFVHREEYYRHGKAKDEVTGQAEIIVAKNRNGPTGDAELTWRKEITRFEDRAPDRYSSFDRYNAGDDADTDERVPYGEF